MPSTPRSIISSKNSRMRSGLGAVEERRVGGDAEAAAERLADPLHRLVVDAVAAHRLVVLLAQPVHVHAERQVLARA